MPILEEITFSINTTGSAGAATGSASTPDHIRGWIEAVHVAKHASLPGTTDLTLVESGGAGRTILALTDIAASGTYYPTAQVHDAAGAGITYDGTRAVRKPFAIAGRKLTASIAQSDELTAALTITLIVSQRGG